MINFERHAAENWGHPNAVATRQKDANFVQEQIYKRADGTTPVLDECVLSRIRAQRRVGTLDYDPEGAATTRRLLQENGLAEEVEALLRVTDNADADKAKTNHPLYYELGVHSAGEEAISDLAGDKDPLGADKKWDANSIKNVAIFLLMNGIKLWHNEFDHKEYISIGDNKEARLTDEAVLDIKMRMHAKAMRVSTEFCHDSLAWIAQKNRKHPVKDYIDGLKWDGKPRLNKMLHTYFGAIDNEYHKLVGSKWMMAAIKRVRNPGCKFDNMLVLEGPQGAFKSTSLRVLSSTAWFTDGMAVGSNAKETIELTNGKWIVETAELAGLSKRDVNEVKQALSKQSDNARLAYGRLSTEVKRQFVFCGTTNNAHYLRDKTGNRRFWCVTVGTIDLEALERDRDQLWAEAAFREAKEERIYLRDAEYDLATEEQAKREEDDEFEIALDDLLGDFEEGQVPKRELYRALGYKDPKQGSGAIGPRALAWMTKRGWTSVREQVSGVRQWCFTKGALPPTLCFDEKSNRFREETSAKRRLH